MRDPIAIRCMNAIMHECKKARILKSEYMPISSCLTLSAPITIGLHADKS
jgi:hypothetical protein